MKRIAALLTSKAFWINLGIAIVVVGIGIFALSEYLASFTRHNAFITVPDFEGFHYTEIDDYISDKNLRFEIVDSIYDPEMPGGVVVEQEPASDSKVKPGRKIYLTINSVSPPMVILPELRGYTLRLAVSKVKSYGLKVDSLVFRPAECSNCIINVQFEGEDAPPGTRIEKNSSITLIVGAGKGTEEIPLPMLYGKTKDEVVEVMNRIGINKGLITYDETVQTHDDSLNAFVYRQIPAYAKDGTIFIGQSIDLFFTLDSNKIRNFELMMSDTTLNADTTIIP